MPKEHFYIIAFIVFLVIDFFVLRNFLKTRKIMKNYFTDGIDEVGLEKMKLSVNTAEYLKFIKSSIRTFEYTIKNISVKEKGVEQRKREEKILMLLKKELKKYE